MTKLLLLMLAVVALANSFGSDRSEPPLLIDDAAPAVAAPLSIAPSR